MMLTRNRPTFRPAVEGFEPRLLLSTIAPPAVVAPSAPKYNLKRFPAERRDLSPGEFPNLGRQFEVIAPFSNRYNCIAWSLGHRDRWVSPRLGTAKNPLSWADKTYAKEGMTRLPTLDTSLQDGVDKVVVYGIVDRKGIVRGVKHAALQEEDGTWTSKMGQGGLIRHPTLKSVSGPLYGRPIAVYAEPETA